MDPEATWARFLEASECGDRADAVAALIDLQAWYERGGFPVAGVNGCAIDSLLDWISP